MKCSLFVCVMLYLSNILFFVVQADLSKERVVTREQGEKLAKVSFLKFIADEIDITCCIIAHPAWKLRDRVDRKTMSSW